MAATDRDRFVATARWVGVEPEIIMQALSCDAPSLVVSGRLASGKDTVAEAVMQHLGCTNAVRVPFSGPLRQEVDQIIDAVRLGDRPGGAHLVDLVAATGGIGIPVARTVTEIVLTALGEDPTVTSFSRTKEVRRLLQFWGTEVRRSVDESYWVKRAMRSVVDVMARQMPVYVTDARFVNELQAARELGMFAVRLEVDFAVRAHRLMVRDGLTIDPEAERHPSEAELDGFDGFDLRVDNSGPLTSTVQAISAAMGSSRVRTA